MPPHRTSLDGVFRIALLPRAWYHKRMKPPETSAYDALQALLLPNVRVLPEGFALDLTTDPAAWSALLKTLGGRRACRAMAETLCHAYASAFGAAFLFSEGCVAYELRYHLNAYLWTQGLRHLRPLSTLPFSRARLVRSCGSVEIDTNDVYRWSQRLIFRYFFGIRRAYRRTERDPYAVSLGARRIRMPLYRKP